VTVHCWLTNRDTLFIRQCAESLAGMENIGEITILDCESTYQPLLDWYDSQKDFRVVRLKNLSAHAPWRSGQDLSRGEPYYFTSDGDLDFSLCPRDFLTLCVEAMEKYPNLVKVGPSLKIDDLPDTMMNRNVIAHEKKFWKKDWDPLWYEGQIDTTAAVYRKGSGWGGYGPALRCKPPYEARHLPWYLDKANLPEDMRHYTERMNVSGLSWGPQFRVKS
jgi:hypothetical protein